MLVMKKGIIGNKSKSLEMCMKVNNEEGNVRKSLEMCMKVNNEEGNVRK